MRLVPYDRYTIVGPFVVPHVPPATPMCDEVEGQPVRISSMVLLVAYAFYYKKCILYRYISPHATRETVSPTPRSTAKCQQSHLSICRVPL